MQFTPTSPSTSNILLDLTDPRTAWQRVERHHLVDLCGVKARLIHHAALDKRPAWKNVLQHASENFLALSPNMHHFFDRREGSHKHPARLMICETEQDPAKPGPPPEGFHDAHLAPDAPPVAVAAFWKRLMEAWGAAAVSAPTPAPPSDEAVGTQWGDPHVTVSGGGTILQRVNVSLWFRLDAAYEMAVHVRCQCACAV